MVSLKTQVFIEKCKQKKEELYDYSKVEYIDNETKVCIICPKHGEFYITPHEFLRSGKGCPICGRERIPEKRTLSQEEVIRRFKEIHGDKYDYSKFVYTKSSEKSIIICPKHGEFLQTPRKHLMGSGCRKCGYEKNTEKNRKSVDEIKEFIQNKFGDSVKVLDNFEYDTNKKPFNLICVKHGEYKTYLKTIYEGQNGCPECFKNFMRDKIGRTQDEFIEKSKEIFGDKYSYDKVEYVNNQTKVILYCNKCKTYFEVTPGNHLINKSGCPTCSHYVSKWEQEINDFINSLGFETIQTDRKHLGLGQEIDIFVPSKNIGIECNGLHWHCEVFKDKDYHLNKTKCAEKYGIRLIHIFEDEWIDKQDIVKSILKNAFGVTERRIYARKCEIKEIDSNEKTEFLKKNHIQGNCNSSINYGLFYNGELASVMTFGKLRKILGKKNEEGKYELYRFVNKLGTTVVGGASKLFKHFLEEKQPKEIISYCDVRLFNGELYEKLGFAYSHNSVPNYFYVVGRERKNRFNYRKDVLIKEGFDGNKTEHEIMLERKLYRIYDCGCKVFVYR